MCTSFQITNIEFSDAGSYECQAIATTRDKSTALVELLVKHAPKVDSIEITPNPLAVNGTVQLKCLASGYPRPSIIWRRENDAILPAGGTSFAYVQSTRIFSLLAVTTDKIWFRFQWQHFDPQRSETRRPRNLLLHSRQWRRNRSS